jgi:F0F1-type ATP synthase assembly protein I
VLYSRRPRERWSCAVKRMDTNAVQALAVASQLGFLIAAAVLIGILAGSFLDARLGTSPLFLIVGAILGTVSGIYSGWLTAKFLLERFGRKKQSGGDQ